MKRSVMVLALLMLFVLLGGQAFTEEYYDPSVLGDDHPWETWEDGNGQGSCNQINGLTSFTATSYFPLDILVNTDVFLIEIRGILRNSGKSNTTYSDSKKRDLYIDRTRQASFK